MNDESLEKIVKEYIDKVNSSLNDRISAWTCSIADREIRDAIGGLLARQVSLATEFAANPGIWNNHVAPILLRCMADVYITFCWVIKDPQVRSRKFIEYGIGQEKLALEKFKGQVLKEKGKIPADIHEFIKTRVKMLEAERYMFLIPINLGSWSEMSMREMAKEIGEERFYDYVFVQFSSSVHSTWQHIWRINLLPCTNPLHGGHRVPANPNFILDLQYFINAANYLCMVFKKFDSEMLKMNNMKYSYSTYDFLNNELDKMAKRIEVIPAKSPKRSSGKTPDKRLAGSGGDCICRKVKR